ncbi:MAG: 6-phosphogluconolactonase [Parachlamydiaceae bacterium]
MSLVESFDERRDVVIPGDTTATILFSAHHFLGAAQKNIQQKGSFFVALSGGSTPKAIYQTVVQIDEAKRIDWSRVFIFFSDERAVPPQDSESNYHMAMTSGIEKLPIPPGNIFRMQAESDIESNAYQYEQQITKIIPSKRFDLVMLGMGEDGHTASLFPETHGLKTVGRLAIANYVPSKKSWRMTLTFECINAAKEITLYVVGHSKSKTVKEVLEGPYLPNHYPVQQVGTVAHKALWILDKEASELLDFKTSI